MHSDALALARDVAAAALATPGVAALGRGRYAEAATYGAGAKVSGVVVERSAVTLHLVASYPDGLPVSALAARVRARVLPLVDGRRIDLVIEDVRTEAERGNR